MSLLFPARNAFLRSIRFLANDLAYSMLKLILTLEISAIPSAEEADNAEEEAPQTPTS